MPVRVREDLPAVKILENEGVFIMNTTRAEHQDIRPLKILILNLMPEKTTTEVQLLRLLGNSPLQTEVELLQTATHFSKNTAVEYLEQFYTTFAEIRDSKYDGMIITGAPVEQLPFEEVDYWLELSRILAWSKNHVYSVFHICWGALAGLYYHYGIKKHPLPAKISGIYLHETRQQNHPLLRGFDDYFYAPHSRNSEVWLDSVATVGDLDILALSKEAGLYLAAHKNGRQVFVTGHGEYDRNTLAKEYFRDVKSGLKPNIPANYFPGNDPHRRPPVNWRCHENLLFANWLNYCVYQQTPYRLEDIHE